MIDSGLLHKRTRPAPENWVAAAVDLVDDSLAKLGGRRTGEPVHVRQWSISRLLRVPADPFPVWFKQFPEFFADEGQVIQLVKSVAPGIVPQVLDSGNGWMITAEMPAERELPNGDPLGVLAQLQISTIGKTWSMSRFDATSSPGWTLDGLTAELENLVQRTDILPAGDAVALDSVLWRLELLCRAIGKLDLPLTLVHGDFRQANIRWTGQGWMLFDWTDAFIGHSFIDLAQPLAEAGGNPAIAASYLAFWAAVTSPGQVAKAFAAAPAIGAANHVAMHRRIVDSVPDPVSYTEILLMWVRRMIKAIDG